MCFLFLHFTAEGFIPTIFQAIVAPSTSDSNKLRAAVYFKNHVMRHWVVDEGETDVRQHCRSSPDYISLGLILTSKINTRWLTSQDHHNTYIIINYISCSALDSSNVHTHTDSIPNFLTSYLILCVLVPAPQVISASDRELIKASIVALYMGAPTPVDAQFEHALGIISHAEFPQAWPDLLSTVVACLSETDGVANRKAFKLLNTLTFHFRVRGETSESMAELGRVDAELIPPMKRILAITIDQVRTDSKARVITLLVSET